jgi:hypothetical protein
MCPGYIIRYITMWPHILVRWDKRGGEEGKSPGNYTLLWTLLTWEQERAGTISECQYDMVILQAVTGHCSPRDGLIQIRMGTVWVEQWPVTACGSMICRSQRRLRNYYVILCYKAWHNFSAIAATTVSYNMQLIVFASSLVMSIIASPAPVSIGGGLGMAAPPGMPSECGATCTTTCYSQSGGGPDPNDCTTAVEQYFAPNGTHHKFMIYIWKFGQLTLLSAVAQLIVSSAPASGFVRTCKVQIAQLTNVGFTYCLEDAVGDCVICLTSVSTTLCAQGAAALYISDYCVCQPARIEWWQV